MGDRLYAADRASWRAWLRAHHAAASVIRLIYPKKNSGKPRIPYDDAVEEALCCGWIDSTVRCIDEKRYMQRFTPRNPRSAWSELKKKRALRLIRQGRMSKAGIAAVKAAQRNGRWKEASARRPDPAVPQDLKKELSRSVRAMRNFDGFASSYRRRCIWWILSAKKPETRRRRIRETVRLCAAGKKPGML